MRKINYEEMKEQILRVLEAAEKPIWISDLYTKYDLPWCSLNSKKDSNASKALIDLVAEGEVLVLMPKEYKAEGRKVRKKICLPSDNPLKRHANRYFEYLLITKIEELERRIEKLKKPWWKFIN